MKTWLTNALVLLVIVGSGMAAFSGEPSVPAGQYTIDVAKEATSVSRANVATNLLAIATLLVNPRDKHKPVPLYGYKISDLEDQTLSSALSLAAVGKVHVAVVKLGKDIPDEGQGIKIVRKANGDELLTQVKTVFDKPDTMIAFTRPLRDKNVAAKFITTPHLWSKFTPAP